ncbi:MAG: hypothetical protein ACF8NJ_09410 [Phycisphaerales bacterium JB038]
MKLPLQTFVSTAMLVATAGLAAADTDPQVLYYLVNPQTGESWQTGGKTEAYWPDLGERSDDAIVSYDSHDGQDIDGDDQNFSVEQEFQVSLVDDYQMTPSVNTTQTLITHIFRAGFGDGSGNSDGRLYVTFYDASGSNEVSSYLINLTGNEGFNTIVVSFTAELAVEPIGRVEFEWNDPDNTSFGLMETDPQVGFNDHEQIWDGVNPITPPPNAWGGISMQLITKEIPAPGSLAPLALAGFGLLTRRRKG